MKRIFIFSAIFFLPLLADGKENYVFLGADFGPMLSISHTYNQTHDLDLGGGIRGGYITNWLQVYGDFLFSGGFGGKIDGKSYSTKGIWLDLNGCFKPLGDIDRLALYIGPGFGLAYFSSDIYDFSKTSWSVNGIVGASQKIGSGRAGMNIEIKYTGITFPPGTENLLFTIFKFYWDFTF
jgi:hypothetical protein